MRQGLVGLHKVTPGAERAEGRRQVRTVSLQGTRGT